MAGNAGSGGAAGGGGGAAGQLTALERDGLHVFDLGGESIFEVDGMTGARVVTFSVDGTNILTGPTNHAMFYGSTLWTGPEQEWASLNPQTFTPVPGIDSDPYTMSIEQGSIIVAQSAPFMVVAKELTASKRFSYDLAKNAVVIDYSLTNVGDAAFDIGLWEVTRVLGQGVTFYPTGANQTTLYGSLAVTAMAGHDWIDHAAFTAGEASKVGSDGTGGWIAHVQDDAAGPLLFIKQYPDIADGLAAPEQHEIEVFEQSDASYIELELHSEYGSLAAGMSHAWQVRWYLRRLPVGTDLSIGSAALIEAVTTAIAP
jgi:hypothetical protein